MIITKRVIRLVILFAVAEFGIYVLWLVRGGLYPFVIALLLAYILNPAVCFFEQKGFKRIWAIIFVYLLLFSTLIIGGSKLIPMLVRELENFGKELPNLTCKSEEMYQVIQWQYKNSLLPTTLRIALDNVLITLHTQLQSLVTATVDAIIGLITHFAGLAISPILAFYLLHDWYVIKEELLIILPGRWRHEIFLFLKDVDKVLSGVIRGQITIALIVGLLVSAGLHLLNVKYALLIGIMAGLLDIIPYFGAVIGATPAVILAPLPYQYFSWQAVYIFPLHLCQIG